MHMQVGGVRLDNMISIPYVFQAFSFLFPSSRYFIFVIIIATYHVVDNGPFHFTDCTLRGCIVSYQSRQFDLLFSRRFDRLQPGCL
jgi:hypothetical protein